MADRIADSRATGKSGVGIPLMLGVACALMSVPAFAQDEAVDAAAEAASDVKEAAATAVEAVDTATDYNGRLDNSSPREGNPYGTRSVFLRADQRYEFSLISDQFDPALELWRGSANLSDPNEDSDKMFASDDDSGEGNASLLEYTPKASGSYKLKVKSVGGELGRYSLTMRQLDKLPAPSSMAAGSASTMVVKEISGQLGSDDGVVLGKYVDDYKVSLMDERLAVITLDAVGDDDDFDPVLVIFPEGSEGGNGQMSNDDGGQRRNSIITFVPETRGDYIIRATTNGTDSRGRYRLRVAQ